MTVVMKKNCRNKLFGDCLAQTNIRLRDSYGWGFKFKKGSIQNFIVGNFGIFHVGARIRNRILDAIISKKDYSDKTMLDAGSGMGLAGVFFSDKFGEVIGIDIDKYKISEARKLAKACGINNISFFKRSLFGSFFGRKKFDVIVCFEVIEHVKNPQELFFNFGQALKKDGILIISFPTKSFISRIAQSSLDHEKVGYLLSDIKKLIKSDGMKIIETYSFGNTPLAKIPILMDFVFKTTIPILSAVFFPIFYLMVVLDYYLPRVGIPRGYVLVLKKG